MKASELRVQPRTENGNRSAVAVVGGIDHELVVQCDARERQRKAVVGFDDLLGTGMRQLSIADENAEPAGVEKRYVFSRNPVDDAGKSEGGPIACP